MRRQEGIDRLHREMLLELSTQFDKSFGSWAYDILKPPAEKLYELKREIQKTDDSNDIFNKSGEQLDIFISQVTPLERTGETHSTSRVRITGHVGQGVPKGTIVSSVSHDYKTVDFVKLDDDGEAEVDIVSVEKGSSTNTLAGEINFFPEIIRGLETVINIIPATGGYDQESDDVFRKRYFDYIRQPITSGNVYHYLLWAGEVDGVGAVKIHPLWDGDNTVKLTVIDSNGESANPGLIDTLQEHIDPKGEKLDNGMWTKWGQGYGEAPLGAFCTIVPANEVSVKVEADIVITDNTSIEQVINEFKVTMMERFSSIALDEEEENIISLARVGATILNIPGVKDYKVGTLRINGGTNNIKLSEEDVAIFEEVLFNEV